MTRDISDLSADRISKISKIIVQTPRLREAHLRLESLCAYGKRREEGGQMCLPMIADSFSGKSTTLATFANRKNATCQPGEVRVLHVTLHPKSTSKQLAQDILYSIQKATGLETNPHKGTEVELYQRVLRFISIARIELIILDEFQHVVNSNSKSVIWNIGETVKALLVEGTCPLVLSGVAEAWLPFAQNVQLRNRAVAPVDLSPMTFDDVDHLAMFTSFIAGMAVEMERQNIIQNSKLLLSHLACILEISQGVIGVTCNFIKNAVEHATLCDRDDLQIADLHAAAERFVQLKQYDRNPFVDGLAPLRVMAA